MALPQPWDPAFPIGAFKQAILQSYAQIVGYTTNRFDVSVDSRMETIEDFQTIVQNTTYMEVAEVYHLRDTYLRRGLPVFLSIHYPGHAVAYMIHGNTCYMFDTQKTETNDFVVTAVQTIISALFQQEFDYEDVLEEMDEDDSFQSDNDDYCVIWMLFIFEMVARFYQLGGNPAAFEQAVHNALELLHTTCDQAGSCLALINQQYERYLALARGAAGARGGRRRRRTEKHSKRRQRGTYRRKH